MVRVVLMIRDIRPRSTELYLPYPLMPGDDSGCWFGILRAEQLEELIQREEFTQLGTELFTRMYNMPEVSISVGTKSVLFDVHVAFDRVDATLKVLDLVKELVGDDLELHLRGSWELGSFDRPPTPIEREALHRDLADLHSRVPPRYDPDFDRPCRSSVESHLD